MSWPTKTMSQRMLDALKEYTETPATMVVVCTRHGVSRRGLGMQIKQAGVSRRPNVVAKGGGNLSGVTGPAHPVWKGVPYIDKKGYLVVYAPDHLFPRKNGQIKEHIRLMELRLGRRLLFDECVHHADIDKRNNEGGNLVLTTGGEHTRLHRSLERGDRL